MKQYTVTGMSCAACVNRVEKAVSKVQGVVSTDALKGLMKLAPKTATLIRDGIEEEVPIETVKTGDIFTVRPGGFHCMMETLMR